MLAKLGPNFDILKSPSNWFLVLFTLALLMIITHVFIKKDRQ